jgi:hypothetical protein
MEIIGGDYRIFVKFFSKRNLLEDKKITDIIEV